MVTDLSKEYPDEETLKSMVEAMELLDKAEPDKPDKQVTKEQIMAIKDTQKRIQAIRDNENLFKGAN